MHALSLVQAAHTCSASHVVGCCRQQTDADSKQAIATSVQLLGTYCTLVQSGQKAALSQAMPPHSSVSRCMLAASVLRRGGASLSLTPDPSTSTVIHCPFIGALLLQDLLESQMGMGLAEMRDFCQADPSSRTQQGLPGAHLPAKGFWIAKKPSAPSTVDTPGFFTRLKQKGSRKPLPSSPSLQKTSTGEF